MPQRCSACRHIVSWNVRQLVSAVTSANVNSIHWLQPTCVADSEDKFVVLVCCSLLLSSYNSCVFPMDTCLDTIMLAYHFVQHVHGVKPAVFNWLMLYTAVCARLAQPDAVVAASYDASVY